MISINGAGVSGATLSIREQSVENWNFILNVNLTGSYIWLKVVAAEMAKNGGGSVVNVASTAGLRTTDVGTSPYVASKFGVVGLTKAAAVDLSELGVRVNAVAPGPIATKERGCTSQPL